MSIVQYNTKELELLARLMRAEALGEGDLGMLMVGNVAINRVIGNCIDFKNIRSITDMVYQSPGGFSSINSTLFNSSPTTKEKRLANANLLFPIIIIDFNFNVGFCSLYPSNRINFNNKFIITIFF